MKIRNPWPYAIIGFFAVAITAIASFITFAVKQNMDLVQKDYYIAELNFSKQMESAARARELGHNVSVTREGATIKIALPIEPGTQGRVYLYRPSDAKLDHSIPLAVGPDGIQRLGTSNLQPGLWKVQVQWTAAQKEFYYDQQLILPEQKT